MLSELNKTGVSTLQSVRHTTDGLAELAKWGKNEIKDSATLAKETNAETRSMRKELAVDELVIRLEKQKLKIAKQRAKFEAKLAASGLNITSGDK